MTAWAFSANNKTCNYRYFLLFTHFDSHRAERIEGSGTLLSELTDTVWSEMLNEAYGCLNADKNHKGRAKQIVTLISSEEVKMMEVTPHLGINTILWSSIPNSEEDAKSKLQEAFRRLRPLYDFVKETIGASSLDVT
jgi:hypothetical protein